MNDKELQKATRESDQLIVPEKSRNGERGKGLARKPEYEKETAAIRRSGERLETELSTLTQIAREKPRCQFTSLAHLLTEEYLKGCLEELAVNKASGIDGVSVREYEKQGQENLQGLVERLKGKKYKPQPLRRVYIPKANGKKRPLGIPAVEDKVVQKGIQKIVEAIFEGDFLDVSYGFRPGRSCHDALEAVDKAIMTKPVNYIVDMDIEKFFDTVDQEWLMKFVRQRIIDSSLLQIIVRILKSGVMEEGQYQETEKGTPQGGIISPLLANIYLHYALDLWFEKVIKKELRGYAQMVRYADDFIVCFQYGDEARQFGKKLRERMSKFGLKISEKKSKIIEFGRYARERAQRSGKETESFDFLGFTHYCDQSRKGKFKVGRKTAKKKIRQTLKGLNQWLKTIRNQVELEDWWKVLGQKISGHYQYYGISGNSRGLEQYYWKVKQTAYKWINRRSQRKSYNWEQYEHFLKYNPLPTPRIMHMTYSLYSK
jgi:RNA-directed DNA polymerase